MKIKLDKEKGLMNELDDWLSQEYRLQKITFGLMFIILLILFIYLLTQ